MTVLRLQALALGVSLALAPSAWAQSGAQSGAQGGVQGWVQGGGAPDAAPRPAAEPAKPAASVTGAATRGITLKMGTTAVSMAVYYMGTGNLATSGAVTAINAVSSYVLYVGNEYMWDTLSPPPRPTEAGEQFRTTTSAWRNTLKFMTFKPAAMLASWTALYAWTGSMATTLTYGGALAVIMPGVFYGNNVAWDWYDWYAAQPPAQPSPTRRQQAANPSSGAAP